MCRLLQTLLNPIDFYCGYKTDMNATQRNANISNAVIESLPKYWKETDSGDFQVVIEGETFSWHSYLLQSCSEFFRCLLRSDMKEKQEMRVELRNMSAATFRLVLKTLYEGVAVLTRENFLEYRQAVVFLQIPFLTEQCEEFAINNLCIDTFDSFKSQAEYLQSKKVLSLIFKFMLDNFLNFRDTEAFLKLSFEELKTLITSDERVVYSEDSVIRLVFDWVNYGEVLTSNDETVDDERPNEPIEKSIKYNNSGNSSQTTEKIPNENDDLTKTVTPSLEKELLVSNYTNEDEPDLRKKMLLELIKTTRYCLVSDTCYANLHQNKLALNNILVKDILSETSAYKQACVDRGINPPAATHRDSSNVENVAITSFVDILFEYSFKKNTFRHISASMPSLQKRAQFTVCMGRLYACSSTRDSTSIYFVDFESHKWVGVDENELMVKLSDKVKIVIGHKNYIYIFSNDIRFYDPNSGKFVSETLSPNIASPEYAFCFYDAILVFSPVKGSRGMEETSVHSWNADTNVWNQLYILPFSCQNMASFYDDVNSYILDSKGNLWKLLNSNVIEFAFLANLWTVFTTSLRGAVLFKDTLYLVADKTPPKYRFSLEGVFTAIMFIEVYKSPVHFVHYVMDKKYLSNQ